MQARELLDTKPSTIVTVHTGSQSDSNLFGILPGISQVATNISEVGGWFWCVRPCLACRALTGVHGLGAGCATASYPSSCT